MIHFHRDQVLTDYFVFSSVKSKLSDSRGLFHDKCGRLRNFNGRRLPADNFEKVQLIRVIIEEESDSTGSWMVLREEVDEVRESGHVDVEVYGGVEDRKRDGSEREVDDRLHELMFTLSIFILDRLGK